MLLDAFLKFEEPTLPGESTDTLHSTEIEILSFEETIVRPTMTPGGTSESTTKVRSEHKPLTIIKPLCKASPKLHQAACAGTVYKKATLSLCQPLGTSKTTSDRWKKIEYLQVKLGTVHITRVHLVGDPALHYFGRATNFPIVAGSVLEMGPIEEIDLTYQTIEWLYKGGTGALNISGKWNLQTNSAT
jgi:type VI secretion system Hcp family effector